MTEERVPPGQLYMGDTIEVDGRRYVITSMWAPPVDTGTEGYVIVRTVRDGTQDTYQFTFDRDQPVTVTIRAASG